MRRGRAPDGSWLVRGEGHPPDPLAGLPSPSTGSFPSSGRRLEKHMLGYFGLCQAASADPSCLALMDVMLFST